MRIVDFTAHSRHDLVSIKKAIYVGDLVVRIVFSDDTEKVVDFRVFLQNHAHPSFTKYLDEKEFRKYKIVNGNLNWNDYDMIFPIEQLYQGKIG